MARLRAELVRPTTSVSAASQLIAFALAAIGTASAAWAAWDAGWLDLSRNVQPAALAVAAIGTAACAGLVPLLRRLRREGVDRRWSD